METQAISSRTQFGVGLALGLAVVVLVPFIWQVATDGTRLENSAPMVFALSAAVVWLAAVQLRRSRGATGLDRGLRWGVVAACGLGLLLAAWLIYLTVALGS